MRFWILGLVATLGACQSTSTTDVPISLTQTSPVAAAQNDIGMMALINAERAAQGLGPVRENPRLSQAARAHAADMVANGTFSHTGSDGSRFFERAAAAGYACASAENIALGQRTEAEVMTSWMGSSGHRRNILTPDAVEFGIGRVDNMWVQLFGRGC